jgi:3-hydroxyisobutyrate dehydrogenase-like beta-hydroxyacid dehydrogenase
VLLTPFGASVEVLDLPAGEASQRKLLRSVFFKGMAASVTEALRAAGAVGLEDWMRRLIADEFEAADGTFAQRLEEGSIRHAVRREEEMAAASELLTELGVPPRVAAASREWLAQLARERPRASGDRG